MGHMAWDRITPALLYFAARRGKDFGNLTVPPYTYWFRIPATLTYISNANTCYFKVLTLR
jgi:hypothetical protein